MRQEFSHYCYNCFSYRVLYLAVKQIWAAPSEFGTYRLCEQRRFRRACASAQSRQNLRCSLIQAVSQEEPSDRQPDPWPLWMAGHAQLKFVMMECSKTQIRLTGLICFMENWWKVSFNYHQIAVPLLYGEQFFFFNYQISTISVSLGNNLCIDIIWVQMHTFLGLREMCYDQF